MITKSALTGIPLEIQIPQLVTTNIEAGMISTNIGMEKVAVCIDGRDYVDMEGAHFILVDRCTPVEIVDKVETTIEDCTFEFEGEQIGFPDCVEFKKCTFINCDNLPDMDKMTGCYITTSEDFV